VSDAPKQDALTHAVLISGGLDSAILLGDALRHEATVFPLYVRCGHSWEGVELAYLERYLHALVRPSLQPLTILEQPVADLYASHWSVTGRGVPTAGDPDEKVFLPGRNVLLLSKAMIWCHLHGVASVALGSLQTNPFPDATPGFFSAIRDVMNQALAGNVELRLPFAGMKKTAVMRLGAGLPLEHSFSCIQPMAGLHCGRCNKCGERKEAFRMANMNDPTSYAPS
jgi:7-cyano-7-deazaguanine synthase